MGALALSLALGAGCAQEEHHAQYDESISPYAANGTSRYEHQTNNVTLEMNGPAGSYTVSTVSNMAGQSDDAIVKQVRESLQRDPEIGPIAPSIQVSADNGMVTLKGTAESDAQKRQIDLIAVQIAGVVIVDNQMHVTGPERQPLAPTSTGEDNNINRVYSTGESNQPSPPSLNPVPNQSTNKNAQP